MALKPIGRIESIKMDIWVLFERETTYNKVSDITITFMYIHIEVI